MELPISREDLHKYYVIETQSICEFCDCDSSPTGEEVCSIIYRIVHNQGVDLPINQKALYSKYMNQVFELHISNEEWRNNYGTKEICNLFYDILVSL